MCLHFSTSVGFLETRWVFFFLSEGEGALCGRRSVELKEKSNGGRRWVVKKESYLAWSPVVGSSCRSAVGGFHSDSVFGADTQISQDVNCLSAGPFGISTVVATVFNKGFFFFFHILIHEIDAHPSVLGLMD